MITFAFPEQGALRKAMGFTEGIWEWRYFPDKESYIRVISDVKDKAVAIICSLNEPDQKTLPLIFLARTLKEIGATKITLFAPYLGYMRQDKSFKSGEAVTSDIFAKLISPYIDVLITIDPHLHRHRKLQEIYTCKCKAVSSAPLMAKWIRQNVQQALLIGPDIESEQWVKTVATDAGAPFIILEKIRHSDRAVEINIPDITQYHSHTPILIDDIISTAATMIKVTELLHQQGSRNIICIATHGIFSNNSYINLQKTGIRKIVTANTIPHPSNTLEVAPLLANSTP